MEYLEIHFLIETDSESGTCFWTKFSFIVECRLNDYCLVHPLKKFLNPLKKFWHFFVSNWLNFELTCGVCISILEFGSSSRSSRSSLSSDSSKLKSSSSEMSFSVMQELVSLVTANFAPFGQRNVPDWSFEQQKLFRIGVPPQKPGQGPCFPLQSKRQFFSLFSSQSGTFIGFSEWIINYSLIHWKCNLFWLSSIFISPGVMQ